MPEEREEPGFVTRAADAGDCVAILALWKRFMTEEGEAVNHVDPDEDVPKWAWRLDRQIQERKAFIVEHGKQIVGFACFIGRANEKGRGRNSGEDPRSPEAPGVQGVTAKRLKRLPIPDGIAYVTDFYVTPGARTSLAARLLFALLLEAVQECGCTAVWTNTSPRNRRVQILLERLGFSTMAGFTLPGKGNDIYYEKKLSD